MRNTATEKFFDDVSNEYESITSSYDYSLFSHTKELYEKYSIDKGSILDAGCGTGMLKLILGDRFNYTGIDFSIGMLSIAESRGYKTIHRYLEDAVLEIKDKSYDHVVCLSVLYFIEDALPVLQKLERIARVSLTVGFEKYTQNQLSTVFKGYTDVKRYNHLSSLVDKPTEILKDELFWTYSNGEKIYGDFVFKRIT